MRRRLSLHVRQESGSEQETIMNQKMLQDS